MEPHFVELPCNCGNDPEQCTMVLYISDVRLAQAEIERLQRELAMCQEATKP
jgi:hypothetical protein